MNSTILIKRGGASLVRGVWLARSWLLREVIFIVVCMLSGPEMWPLYGVERWPQIRGFLSTILNGHAVGTEISIRYRQGGRTLEVVVK